MNGKLRAGLFLFGISVFVLIALGMHREKLLTGEAPYIVVLGIAQDAGFPQADCTKDCCAKAWKDHGLRRMVASIGIVDPKSKSSWMIDATPDFKDQLQVLSHREEGLNQLKGILLTHAHIGHYTGLMHLGREVMGAQSIPVFAMPKMSEFLTKNGPWSQLVSLNNIRLNTIQANEKYRLTEEIDFIPIRVPHRDEFSETVGYEISGPNAKLLYIPDIDKWSKWDRNLISEIDRYDYLLIDGSFYADGEIPNRDMSEIPHPFVAETTQLLSSLPDDMRSRIQFIHLNHTNPLLDNSSPEFEKLTKEGWGICHEGQQFSL